MLSRQYLECRECAATYCWHLRLGRITLSYRYSWIIWQPTSPAWINLLDGGPRGLGMFNEDNRHLLWCDEPGCATGMGRRWEEMLKQAIWLQDVLYGARENKEGAHHSRCWSILESARRDSRFYRDENDFCLEGFELAPHLLKSRHIGIMKIPDYFSVRSRRLQIQPKRGDRYTGRGRLNRCRVLYEAVVKCESFWHIYSEPHAVVFK